MERGRRGIHQRSNYLVYEKARIERFGLYIYIDIARCSKVFGELGWLFFSWDVEIESDR